MFKLKVLAFLTALLGFAANGFAAECETEWTSSNGVYTLDVDIQNFSDPSFNGTWFTTNLRLVSDGSLHKAVRLIVIQDTLNGLRVRVNGDPLVPPAVDWDAGGEAVYFAKMQSIAQDMGSANYLNSKTQQWLKNIADNDPNNANTSDFDGIVSWTTGHFHKNDWDPCEFHEWEGAGVVSGPIAEPARDDCEALSQNPISLFTGKVVQSESDLIGLPAEAPAGLFGQLRTYQNDLAFDYDGPVGINWRLGTVPYLREDLNGTTAVMPGGRQILFEENAGVYTPVFGEDHVSLAYDAVNAELVLSEFPQGQSAGSRSNSDVWCFHSFGVLNGNEGLLKQVDLASGESVATLGYTDRRSSGLVWSRSDSSKQRITYNLNAAAHVNEYRISDATYWRLPAGMPDIENNWEEISRAAYSYYGDDEDYGYLNDLKSVIRQKWDGAAWADCDTRVYRYWTADQTNYSTLGFPHGLKYVVGPVAYQRLSTDGHDPLTVIESTLAGYADMYLEYDPATRRVTKEIAATGCASCGGSNPGTTGDTFAYFDNDDSGYTDDFNHWFRRTTVTHPDGLVETVYMNYAGQVMLRVEDDGIAPRATYTRYDTSGRPELMAGPDAVDLQALSTHEGHLDLLNESGGSLQYLDDNAGLITKLTYDDTHGGQISTRTVQEGELGASTLLMGYEYETVTQNGLTLYPIKKRKTYPVAGGSAAETVYTNHEWHPGATQVKRQTIAFPVVAASQNGSGVAASSEAIFDEDGRPVWTKDPRGIIEYTEYREDLGLPKKQIIDVDMGDSSLPMSKPAWNTSTTVVGAGEHLVHEFEYDDLGRPTQRLGIEHEAVINGTATTIRPVIWWRYNDNSPTQDDETRLASGFIDGGTSVLVDPIEVTHRNKNGDETQSYTTARSGGQSGALTGTESLTGQSLWQSWSTAIRNDKNQVEEARTYHTIPTSGEGDQSTNYELVKFHYDSRGRLSRTQDPTGTVTRSIYDVFGNETERWVGTNDGCECGDWDEPSDNVNMVQVAGFVYDNRNQLTTQTSHVDGSNTRSTTYAYDFRGRLESMDGEEDLFAEYTYDNMDRVIQTERKHISDSGQRLTHEETEFDDRGRVYETMMRGVDPDTGNLGDTLTSRTWYDEAGQIIKEQAAGVTAFSKHTYDSLGLISKTYAAYDTSETLDYADAIDVAGDMILVQSEFTYNETGQLLSTAVHDRQHDDTTTTSGLPVSRVTYTAEWYDGVGRNIATADHGDNGFQTLVRANAPPASSSSVLVTQYSYDVAGRMDLVTASDGKQTKRTFDAMNRVLSTIDNYVDGTAGPDDEDRVAEFTYRPDSAIATRRHKNPGYPDQVTTYVYGVIAGSGGDEDSDLTANHLLRGIIYPDSDDPADLSGNGADGVFDREVFAYNRLGELKSETDRREVVRATDRDGLGRVVLERVSSLGRTGESVDSTVRSIATAYTDRGEVEKVASWASEIPNYLNSPLNEIQYVYDDFGQRVEEYQEHDGIVAVGTGGSSSPAIRFAYDAAKGQRLDKMTYPNGTDLVYAYDGSANDSLSRANQIWGNSVNPNTDGKLLANYEYLGSGRLAKKSIGSGLTSNGEALILNFAENHPDSTSVTETYGGYDRFGRIARMHWRMEGGIEDKEIFDIRHGYDTASNKLYADRRIYDGHSQIFDHDELDRLTKNQRGQLSFPLGTTAATIENLPEPDKIAVSPRNFQEWSLDALDNQLALNTGSYDYRKNAQFNESNELIQQEVRANRGIAVMKDDFSSQALMDEWEKPEASDNFQIVGSRVQITSLGSDGKAIALFGGLSGPDGLNPRWRFLNGVADGTRAGIIFGYVDANNYWLITDKYDAVNGGTREYAQVKNGVETVMHTASASNAVDTWRWWKTGTEVSWMSAVGTGYMFADGFPGGKIGLYAESTSVEFDYFHRYTHDHTVMQGDRWENFNQYGSYGSMNSGGVVLASNPDSMRRPVLLSDIRLSGDSPWKVTFKVNRYTGIDDGLKFVFNARDHLNCDMIRMWHRSGSTYSLAGYHWEDGVETTVLGAQTHVGNWPDLPNATDDLWVRVEFNGAIWVKGILDNSGPPSESTWNATAPAYTGPFFDMTGGRIGFYTYGGVVQIQSVEVTEDTNQDAQQDLQFVSNMESDFGDYTTIEYAHDAAGNLVFDGDYHYRYDAWNRLIEVHAAFSDSSSTNGVYTVGSLVSSYEYDGLNRRIERVVTNSGPLDATHHDYYLDWQLVETRTGTDQVIKQHVWGLDYVDELVAIVNNSSFTSDADFDHEFDPYGAEIFMSAHDSMFNPLGLFRFSRLPGDADNDGDVDLNDLTILGTFWGTTDPAFLPFGDFNNDDQVDQADLDILVQWFDTNLRAVPVERYEFTPYGERKIYVTSGPNDLFTMCPISRSQRIIVDGMESPYALNDFGFQGLLHDEVTDLVYQRNRYANVRLGRFMQNDPMGYPDGGSRYAMYHVLRGQLDPYGLMSSDSDVQAVIAEINRLKAAGYSQDEANRLTNSRVRSISRAVNRQAALRQIGISARDRAGKSVDFAQGYFIDAPKGMIRGTVDMVIHPVETGKNLLYAVRHPGQALDALIQGVKCQVRTDRGKGQVLGDIAWGVFTGGIFKTADRASDASQTARQANRVSDDASGLTKSSNYANPIGPIKLNQQQKTAIRKINNIIKHHLKPGPKGDISGTVSDMVGNPVPKIEGGFFDHAGEMNDTLRGLRKRSKVLDGVNDPAAKAARAKALEAIQEIEEAIQGAGI